MKRQMIWVWLCACLLMLSGQSSLQMQAATDHAGWTAQAPAWDGTLRRIRVPILMYHYVSTPPDTADTLRVNLSLEPEDFRAQMEYLFYEGFTPVSLYALHNALQTGAPLPAKPVILTFDDGYADHYTNVFPVLREFGFTGTFFIITGTADNNVAGYLTWPQIAEMSAAGMSMESHTRDHPDLRGRDYPYLVYQLLGALESLAAYTSQSPGFLAYPVGHYDDLVLTVLRTMPVRGAVTTQPGDLHTTGLELEMPRVRISYGMGAGALAGILGNR
ncbi:MAG: polysaccharide deacetylase family protein [Pleurocapsa minor GSE-CHR-MK-17-07R]|jgi:peptidoglycan/xylan/chitin deacetylase (PgdA/CDA1 family)|nr:polysaccharide deacetylase family protein [Pleurocapsa minor GSE-CHR-MK 17-07R]